MIVYAVVDDALSPNVPLGDSLEVFVGREDAERFIEKSRGWWRCTCRHETLATKKREDLLPTRRLEGVSPVRGSPQEGACMDGTSTSAMLVDTPPMLASQPDGLTVTVLATRSRRR